MMRMKIKIFKELVQIASRLHAGQSEKLGTYGDPWNTDYEDDYILEDIINE